MAPSQPFPPPQLAREKSLCASIAELWSTSAIPFDDPFSADMAAFAEEFLADDSETPALPSSFARVADTSPRPIVYSLPPASTWDEFFRDISTSKHSKFPPIEEEVETTRNVFHLLKHFARTSSDVSLASTTRTAASCDDSTAPAISNATHDTSNSCSESDTEQLSDASEGTSSPPTRAGSAPRSRWTTQERSLFLATVATLGNTLDTSHSSSANDTRNLAAAVVSVVGTRSAGEVLSHARRALKKLRARAETKSVSASIKTLLCIVGSSDLTG
jgi:hypothetical protein